MEYQLRLPRKVFAGENALKQLKTIVEGKFTRAALFTDRGVRASGALDAPLKLLEEAGVPVDILDNLAVEPTCDQAQQIVEAFRSLGADVIVAVGGGSVMDVAKLACLDMGEGRGVRDLLEAPQAAVKRCPTVMIPTTAGTGSEATPNSIVSVPERQVKVGIVNEQMLPDFVILDGAMIRNLPAPVAAATGIDALCHAVECYTSLKANPFSDLFALEAIRLILPSLEKSCFDPAAMAEKNNMLLAAFYGGAAIAASGTTAVHALSYPLGGRYHIPHGIANATLLLPVMRFNREACRTQLAEICRAILPCPPEGEDAQADRALEEIEKLMEALPLKLDFQAYGVGPKDIDVLVEEGLKQQRLLVNNRRPVSREDARAIYREVLSA